MNENTAMASPTASNPSLPVQLTLDLVQASIAAFQAYSGQPVVLPALWAQVAEINGWVDGYPEGKPELFALLLQNEAYPDQFIVAFRGTNTDADAITEAFCEPTDFIAEDPSKTPSSAPQVGKGFFKIYSYQGTMPASMQSQLFTLLKQYPVGQLYLTGHSLGGALAELFALDVSLCLQMQTPATIITFAAPMVGIQSWGQAYAAGPGPRTKRVVNQNDVVPKLPPSWLAPNYVQVGTEFDIAFQPQTTGLPQKDITAICHATTNYQYVLEQALPSYPQQWAGTFADLSGVGQNITDVSTIPSS